jgi:hypothetical protein
MFSPLNFYPLRSFTRAMFSSLNFCFFFCPDLFAISFGSKFVIRDTEAKPGMDYPYSPHEPTIILPYILQRGISHNVVFIESQSFTRRLKQLAGDSASDVLLAIQNDLLQDPERGEVVKGLGGIRKARVANPARGKGTRGGYRCMHLYLARRDHIHLLFLLDKNEQEDLDEKQRKALRQMVAELKKL